MSQTWTQIPAALNTEQRFASAVKLGEDILVFGGMDLHGGELLSVEKRIPVKTAPAQDAQPVIPAQVVQVQPPAANVQPPPIPPQDAAQHVNDDGDPVYGFEAMEETKSSTKVPNTQDAAPSNTNEQDAMRARCSNPTCMAVDGGPVDLQQCSCCRAYYCDRQCQKAHWQEHKQTCTYYLNSKKSKK